MKKWLFSLLLMFFVCANLLPLKAKADVEPVSYWEYDETNHKMVRKETTSYQLLSDYPESPQSTEYLIEIGDPETTSVYYVDRDMSAFTYSNIVGDVLLILKDGVTLTIPRWIRVCENVSLKICGQTEGTGAIVVQGLNGPCIELALNSVLTVDGGTISLASQSGNTGIMDDGTAGQRSFTINGGTVTVTAGEYYAGIGGKRWKPNKIDVTINGGNLTVTGGTGAVAIGAGADATAEDTGSINIAPGMRIKAGADAASAVYTTDYLTSPTVYASFSPEPWKALKDAMASGRAYSCAEFDAIETSDGLLIEIHDDITSSDPAIGPLVVPQDSKIALRLNGNTLDRAVGETPIDDGFVIWVQSGSVLKVYDDNNTGKITGGNSTGCGGGIYSTGNLSLILTTVDGNKAAWGGGVYGFNGSVTLYGAVISNNTATNKGGGLYMSGNITLQTGYINNKVTGNNSVDGAGIYMYKGTAMLGSVEISNNTASGKGGGIYNYKAFVGYSGVNIANCSAKNGGGVYVENEGRFEAVGGEIKNCSATGEGACGGGIYVAPTAVATLADNIKISNCSATNNGGGIYADDAVGLSNCTITECTVTDGNGGGIYVCDGDHVFLGQAPKVTGNKKGTANNNLYVAEGGLVTLGTGADVPAPSTGMNIGITLESANEFITNDATGCDGYFTPDDDDYVIVLTDDKTLLITLQYTVSFNMNGHGTQIDSQTVIAGETATEPSEPSATGYIFEGWCLNVEGKPAFDFDTEITEDTELIAKWKEVDPLPPTGDTNGVFICLAILLISGCALAAVELYRKQLNR